MTFLKSSKQSNTLGDQGKATHYAAGFISCVLDYGNCGTIMLFISSFSVAVKEKIKQEFKDQMAQG